MLVAEQFVEIERRLRTAIACHRDEHFAVTAQLFLMAASLASSLPEPERAALGQRLAALGHNLVAGGMGRPH